MTEEERYCWLNIALLVHEMDVEGFEAVDLDGGLEVRKLIDLGFLFPPVVFVFPVCR